MNKWYVCDEDYTSTEWTASYYKIGCSGTLTLYDNDCNKVCSYAVGRWTRIEKAEARRRHKN